MTSNAQGNLVVPIWVEDGVIKPLVDDEGAINANIVALDCEFPVILQSSDITLDVNLKSQSIVPDVNLKTSSITLPTSEQSPLTNIQSRGYGWDLSNWRKEPIKWGYHGQVAENLGGTASAAQYTGLSTAVSAGYIHIINGLSIRNVSRAVTICHLVLNVGGFGMYVKSVTILAQYIPLLVTGQFVLKEGDTAQVTMNGCTIGDTIQAGVCGYSMKINE